MNTENADQTVRKHDSASYLKFFRRNQCVTDCAAELNIEQ
jgi:hypothetical protein